MRFTTATRLIVLLSTLAGASCDAGEDRVLAVRATAVVLGIVFLDGNGNRVFDGSDAPFAAVGVRLVARGTRDTVAKASSGPSGAYVMFGVPVGEYLVVVDTTTLGDTLGVVRLDPALPLRPNDTAKVTIGVSYPSATVAQVRALAPGRRVFVDGVALNGAALFGDTTVHFVDATGAIRATRVRPTSFALGPSDSLRLLGRRSTRAGQPTLDDVTAFLLGAGLSPAAAQVTTNEAASARGGALDAQLVRIVGAAIIDTVTTPRRDFRLTVNDGSGPLVVIFDADARLPTNGFTPGVVMEAFGVLVPTGAGGFQLKPRFVSDLVPQ